MSSTVSAPSRASRSAPRLLRVERLGLVAVARAGEVEVAGDAQQVLGRDGAARPAAAVGDVGLDRAEIAAAVEDDRELLAEREAGDPERDRSRGVLIDQGAAEQFVGEMVVHVPSYRQFADPIVTHWTDER